MHKVVFILFALLFTAVLRCDAQKYSSKPVGSHRDLYRHGRKGDDSKEKRPGLSKKKDVRPGFSRAGHQKNRGRESKDKLSVRGKSKGGHHNTYHDSYSTGSGYQKSSPNYHTTGLKHHV